MNQQELFLDNMPVSNDIWREIGGNYETAEQSINELVDNSISNILGKNSETRKIEITLEETNDINQAIYIAIEDSGMGIENPEQAFTLGAIGSDSVFNEHGFGWKQALSAANPENDAWEMYLRIPSLSDENKVMQIKAPYVIGRQKYELVNSRKYPGHSWGRTYIRVKCNFMLFQNLIDAEAAARSDMRFDFDSVADRIYEDLGFTYSEVLETCKIQLILTLKHYNGTKEHHEVTPLKPIFKSSVLKFTNEELHFECTQGAMEALPARIPFNNKSSNRYYKQNITSSGVEIRINGRVVEHNLFEEIYGTKNHPAFNDWLIQINIVSNNREDLPATRTTKNGFRVGDEQLSKIFGWLRRNLRPTKKGLEKPISVSETELKRKLAEIIESNFFSEKELDLNMPSQITQREVPLFTSILKEGYPKCDLMVSTGEKVTVIEAKKNDASIPDLYQLMMYCDGYFFDHGVMPDEAIIVAKEFSDPFRRVVALLNERNKNKYPPFTWKYWNEFMENFEEVIRDEKKLKMKY